MLDAHLAMPGAPRLRYEGALRGVRVVVVAGEPRRTKVVVEALERDGAVVGMIDPRGSGLERAREIDPHILLVDPTAMAGAGTELSRLLDDDPRLRWATVVRVAYRQPWERIRKDLFGTIALAVEPDVRFATAARMRVSCTSELDGVGPSRVLRAVDGGSTPVCVAAASETAVAEVVIASELVVSAWWWESGPSSAQLSGVSALSAFVGMRRARITTMPCETLDRANVLAPISEALHEATAALDEPLPALQEGHAPTQHDAMLPPPPVEWDEDDFTTERFARAVSEVEAEAVLRQARASVPEPPPASKPASIPPPTKPSSIAPVSIERARETLGERSSSPWWVIAAAVILLGSVGGAIALQPERFEPHRMLVATKMPDAKTIAGPPAVKAADPSVVPPAAPPADPSVERGAAAAAVAEAAAEDESPAWLRELPEHPRRAVLELVRRARALEREDPDQAEQIYRYAHELDPRAPRPMAGLAEVALGRGNASEAASWAARAAEASPRRASYRVLLGDALAAQGDEDRAYDAWLEAQRLAPHSRIVRARLGR